MFFVSVMVLSASTKSRNREGKFTTILTYEANDNILELRPFDYTFASKTQRVDLLIGRRLKGSSIDFIAYGYWKWDNKDRSWIGMKLDFGIKTLKERLSANLDVRYFHGLNDKSKPHLYTIPTIYYQFDSKGIVKGGFSGYRKKSKGKDLFFYVGLDSIIKVTNHISILFSYSRDIYGSGDFVWWIVFFYF